MTSLAQKRPSLLRAWVMAVRLRTLTIPTIQVISGLALGYAYGIKIDWSIALCTMLVGLFVTIAVNLFNDAIDFRNGGDPIGRHGHLKVIPAGFLTQNQVMRGGFVFVVLTFLVGIPLMMKGGVALGFILMLSCFLAYSYTGGPFPICYLGLSEIFILIFYGFVCVGASFYLQAGFLNFYSFLLSLQMGCLAILPNALNNFRDQEEDRQINKLTLVVRLGKRFGMGEMTALILVPFLLGLFWLGTPHPMAAIYPLGALPLASLLVYLIWRTEPGPVFNRYFVMGVSTHMLFGFLICLGLIK